MCTKKSILALLCILVAPLSVGAMGMLDEMRTLELSYAKKLGELAQSMHQKAIFVVINDQKSGRVNHVPGIQQYVKEYVISQIDDFIKFSETLIKAANEGVSLPFLWMIPTTLAFEEQELAALKEARQAAVIFSKTLSNNAPIRPVSVSSQRLVHFMGNLIEKINEVLNGVKMNATRAPSAELVAVLGELLILKELQKVIAPTAK